MTGGAATDVMLPRISRSVPDFTPVFERHAADLKKEAARTGVH